MLSVTDEIVGSSKFNFMTFFHTEFARILSNQLVYEPFWLFGLLNIHM